MMIPTRVLISNKYSVPVLISNLRNNYCNSTLYLKCPSTSLYVLFVPFTVLSLSLSLSLLYCIVVFSFFMMCFLIFVVLRFKIQSRARVTVGMRLMYFRSQYGIFSLLLTVDCHCHYHCHYHYDDHCHCHYLSPLRVRRNRRCSSRN
jgi:hypothetical protein